MVCVIDLSVANSRLVVTARSSLWDRPKETLDSIDALEETNGGESMVRVFRTNPMIWSTKNEWLSQYLPNRLEQIVDYEIQTLMSRHHLVESSEYSRIGLVESFRSIEDKRFATLMSLIRASLPV